MNRDFVAYGKISALPYAARHRVSHAVRSLKPDFWAIEAVISVTFAVYRYNNSGCGCTVGFKVPKVNP
jgi:hypothetical protein